MSEGRWTERSSLLVDRIYFTPRHHHPMEDASWSIPVKIRNLPKWSVWYRIDDDTASQWKSGSLTGESAYGLPVRWIGSFWCMSYDARTTTVTKGIAINEVPQRVYPDGSLVLPTSIRPAALLISMSFWIVSAFGMLRLPARVRRWIRLRKGEHPCRTCGYDCSGIVGKVCPECGGDIVKSRTSGGSARPRREGKES